ncbi:MAG: Mannose-1-phosphate guanylyltransferase [uncultured Quadrisphaera sp.]|uniref:Mannose-1-phosphate guanylyltransferase n=1 Tax=uncultured Quadrisphaera sp. TaxID=904978 RepID=A0A6J4PD79_9ACTN|nr:MAG: Mannose-1-phosphate guanylyltransferase [uncultured Quadrisphaera sp.]
MSAPASPSSEAPVEGFAAVVPAGGAGTRLWPLSRSGAPKFLHDLTGAGCSLLQGTWSRLEPLCGADRLLVVTGAAHAGAVREQLPHLAGRNLLLEPSPRDSMAAIGLAAAVLARREGEDVVLGSFAADHVIADRPETGDVGRFAEVVRQAVTTARAGHVVTIGITPTAPVTGFGYIAAGEPLGLDGAPLAQRVAEFVEKPDAATAVRYLATGRYRWNAGMFVVAAGVLLRHLAQQLPALHDGLREVAAAWDAGGGAREEALARVWPGLTRIAIDHAIAEPVAAAGGVAVVEGGFAWDDVGDWDSLASLLPGDEPLAVLGDRALVHAPGSTGIVVPAAGRAVTVLGLADAVVVDTPDAVLVTTRAHAQQVKGSVAAWRDAGRPDLV